MLLEITGYTDQCMSIVRPERPWQLGSRQVWVGVIGARVVGNTVDRARQLDSWSCRIGVPNASLSSREIGVCVHGGGITVSTVAVIEGTEHV